MSTAALGRPDDESALMAAMVPAGLLLPDDVAALQSLVLAREAALAAAQAEIVQARARDTMRTQCGRGRTAKIGDGL